MIDDTTQTVGRIESVLDPDWITITLANSGFKKRVRRSAIAAFGMMADSIGASMRRVPYVEINGHAIVVTETEDELAALLGAQI